MLHELLVALHGHPGPVFCRSGDKMVVNTSIDMFHPCEVAIINQVLELAADYSTLSTFISGRTMAEEGGMYLEALSHGLDKVLGPYRDALTALEERALASPAALPLSLLHHTLLPHRPVLKVLVEVVRAVEGEGAPRGCRLLDLVYRAASSGVQGAGAALEQVLAVGHQVLYQQLLAWLLQGHLYDPLGEFFIVVEEELGEESLLVGEVEGETSRSKSRRYRLDMEQVPGHISPALAEKIFFIGESIQLFESDRRVQVQGDVLESRELEFYRELARLRDSTSFSVTEFARFVDRIRESVSCHLHRLVVTEGGLAAELRTVWDIFLLGRGELALAFITAAEPVLRGPPGGATQHDAIQAWQSALGQHEGEERLAARATPRVSKEGGSSGWEALSMQYAVPWPLHLVVTAQALEKYNRILAFLLAVRRAQRALHALWAQAMLRSRGNRRALATSTDTADTTEQTRSHMTFLLDSLQYYLMADVLDTKITELNSRLDKSTSFEEVKTCHDQFLTEVQGNLFLHNPQVLKCLTDLMENCRRFCSMVEAGSDPSSCCLAFTRQAALLVQLLASLRSRLAPAGLAQLLTRIDYNRFFTRRRPAE